MSGRPLTDWRVLLPTLAATLESNGRLAPAWVSARTQRLARSLLGALADDLARASRDAGTDVDAEAVTGVAPRRISEWRARGWLPPVGS